MRVLNEVRSQIENHSYCLPSEITDRETGITQGAIRELHLRRLIEWQIVASSEDLAFVISDEDAVSSLLGGVTPTRTSADESRLRTSLLAT